MGDHDDAPPTLDRGIGAPTRCRSCKAEIVFAIAYATGKKAPYQKDHEGEWIFENGLAKHVGKPAAQSDLFAPASGPQRYTSHFAVCPQAGEWRQPK
jgi:hypothetical protein